MQPNPLIMSTHEKVITKKALTRYNITRLDLKTFTFSAGSECQSIENAVLGPLPKPLLFTMIKNAEFNGSVDTNLYKFWHYNSEFSLSVNGKRVPSEGLSVDTVHDKRRLFIIEHSSKGPVDITRTRDYR
jgi:hypothetical protein